MARESILVVEPDEVLLKTISEQILLPDGFKPFLARDQEQGLDMALTESPLGCGVKNPQRRKRSKRRMSAESAAAFIDVVLIKSSMMSGSAVRTCWIQSLPHIRRRLNAASSIVSLISIV